MEKEKQKNYPRLLGEGASSIARARVGAVVAKIKGGEARSHWVSEIPLPDRAASTVHSQGLRSSVQKQRVEDTLTLRELGKAVLNLWEVVMGNEQ